MSRCTKVTDSMAIVGAVHVLTIPKEALSRRCLRRENHEGSHLIQRHDQTFILWSIDLCGEEISPDEAMKYLFE